MCYIFEVQCNCTLMYLTYLMFLSRLRNVRRVLALQYVINCFYLWCRLKCLINMIEIITLLLNTTSLSEVSSSDCDLNKQYLKSFIFFLLEKDLYVNIYPQLQEKLIYLSLCVCVCLALSLSLSLSHWFVPLFTSVLLH